jgi:hypothetical protein
MMLMVWQKHLCFCAQFGLRHANETCGPARLTASSATTQGRVAEL